MRSPNASRFRSARLCYQRSGIHDRSSAISTLACSKLCSQVLLQRGTRDDVEELPGDVSSGNSYGAPHAACCRSCILAGYIQYIHIYQGYITVLVADLVTSSSEMMLSSSSVRLTAFPHRAQWIVRRCLHILWRWSFQLAFQLVDDGSQRLCCLVNVVDGPFV